MVARSSAEQQEASIAGIRNIIQEPGSNRVRIDYERALPETVQGSVNDPQIQALLVMASRSTANSGLRMDSVDLLRQKPDDPAVRESLVYSLALGQQSWGAAEGRGSAGADGQAGHPGAQCHAGVAAE